jgi:KDO2-lipid IV(A) lauroyltransferase
MSAETLRDRIRIPDLAAIKGALMGHSGLMLGCHAGSWELSHAACAAHFREAGYAILAQPQKKYKRLDAYLNALRARKGCRVFRVDELKKVVGHLEAGGILGFVADHGGRDGVAVDFFGKPAMTPVGSLRFARRFKSRIFLAYMHRVGGPDHEILFKPFEPVFTGDESSDLRRNLAAMNRIFEEWIARFPEEYLWFFRRWKYSPRKDVLILSDGKAGHLKQSLAVADLIAGAGVEVRTEIKDVRYRNGRGSAWLSLAGRLFGRRALRALAPRVLAPPIWELLRQGSYDIILSAGASLAAVNLALAYENDAKSVVLMRPGVFPLSCFDRVILPEHDRLSRRPNTTVISGALSNITAGGMEEDFERLGLVREGVKGLKEATQLKIGFLVGGDSKTHRLAPQTVGFLCDQLLMFAEAADAFLLATTSRRTSREVAVALKRQLGSEPRCRLLVVANEENPPGTIGGLFYLSDILVVSGESISMVSEAVASGKPVVVFEPRALSRKNKVRRFLSGMSRRGHIRLVKPNELYSTLEEFAKAPPPRTCDEERLRVSEDIKKIL